MKVKNELIMKISKRNMQGFIFFLMKYITQLLQTRKKQPHLDFQTKMTHNHLMLLHRISNVLWQTNHELRFIGSMLMEVVEAY